MKTTKLSLAQSKLANALKRLEEIKDAPIDVDNFIIDAAIQRFEFTFELFWKWLKLILLEQGIAVYFPKEVFKEAYKAHMIDDEAIWLQMLNDRNLTSHTYNQDLALSIYMHITIYTPLIRKIFEKYKTQSTE